MRLKEPFQGFRLITGHAPAHMVFLLGSYLILDQNPFKTYEQNQEIIEKTGFTVSFVLKVARASHLIELLLKSLKIWASYNNLKILQALLSSLTVVCIMLSVFFIQYNVSNTEIDDWAHGTQTFVNSSLEWLLIEVVVFYLFILSGSVYLGSISCRGIYKLDDFSSERKERQKYDSIEYYRNDLDWFIQIFVFLGLDVLSALQYHYLEKIRSQQKKTIKIQSFFKSELHLLYICIILRIYQMVTMKNLYNRNRQIRQLSKYHWIVLTVGYLYCIIWLILNNNLLRCQRTIVTMDIIMYFMTFFQYVISIQVPDRDYKKHDTPSQDQNKAQIKIDFKKLSRQQTQIKINELLQGKINKDYKKALITTQEIKSHSRIDKFVQLWKYNKNVYKSEQERKDCKRYKKDYVELGGDVYSMAFVAFIDPEQMDDKDLDFLKNISEDEINNIFIGVFLIVFFQMTMIFSLVVYMLYMMNPPLQLNPGENFQLTLAKFVSSLMLHLNCEPEIRQGLVLAKYVVNHPFRFKGARKLSKDGQENVSISSIITPFLIALCQIFTTLIIELISLSYLNCIQNLMSVVVQFITFLGITKFDNMYFDTLLENRLMDVKGKKLKKYFFRSHIYLKKEFDLDQQNKLQEKKQKKKKSRSRSKSPGKKVQLMEIQEYDKGKIDLNQSNKPIQFKCKNREEFYLDPKRNSLCLKFMRFYLKFLRLIYLTVVYYFMPFVFTFITFIVTLPYLRSSPNQL